MNARVILGFALMGGLSACANFQRHDQSSRPTTPSVVTDAASDSMSGMHATPVESKEKIVAKNEAAEPNVKMSGTPTATKGQASGEAQPDIKLIDKNGKVITAPAQASVNGKAVTKVEVSPGEVDAAVAPLTKGTPAEGMAVAANATPPSTAVATDEAPAGARGFVASNRKAGPVGADKALGWLKNGNIRFVKNRFRKDGAQAADRKRVASHSAPHAVVLADSDSRVPPEVIFDQKLGEIYVVRVAGLSLNENVIGSIEYAMEYLGSNLIVVLGQESSPAIKAALGTLDGGGLGSPNLNGLIAAIRPHLQEFRGKAPSENLVAEAWANNDGVAHELSDRSQIIREGLTSGDVKIAQGVYHLNSGVVDWK